MAATISRYNHTENLIFSGALNLSTFKFMLVDGTTAFDATHTTLSAATASGADEVSGNGWTAGGELLTITTATVTTNDAHLDAENLVIAASGGAIVAEAGIIYDDTHASDAPLWHVNFNGTVSASDGANFEVRFDGLGLHVSS